MASSTLLLQDLTYTYDPVGNITRIVDASETDAAKTVDFEYDPLHRLTRASSTGAANDADFLRTYAYDPLGNITSKSDQGSYLYQGDQGASYANPHAVTSIGAQTITYDNNGNLLTDGSHTNIWDYRNRLATSTVGATSTGFAYDHENQRVKLYDGSATTIYPNRLYNVRGATTTIHIFDDQGQLIATVEGNGAATSTYYLHADHLGGSSIVSDEAGEQAQLIDYYPFGSLRLNDQAAGFDEQRKFTGHEYDAGTALTYAGARYYDQGIGRWLSQDPVFVIIGMPDQVERLTKKRLERILSNPQGLNSYSYAPNNPIIYRDPRGLFYYEASLGGTFYLGSGSLGFQWDTKGIDLQLSAGPALGIGGHAFVTGMTSGDLSHQFWCLY